MRYADAFKLFFQDEHWTNNAMVGFIFVIIPLVGPLALSGWHCEIARRLVDKHERPIPRLEFNDLVKWLERGVTPFVAQMIAAFPVSMLAGLISAFAMIMVSIGMAQRTTGLVVVGLVVMTVFIVVLSIVAAACINALVTRAELTGDLTQTLQFGEVFAYLKATFWQAVRANIVMIVVATVFSLIGMLACFIGAFVVAVALGVAQVSIRVQIYEKYLDNGGTPIPLGDPNKPGIFSGGGL